MPRHGGNRRRRRIIIPQNSPGNFYFREECGKYVPDGYIELPG